MHPPTGGVCAPSAICSCSARNRLAGCASAVGVHPPRRAPPTFHVNVAVAYGGRQEIVDAVRALLSKELANGATGEELVDAVTVEASPRTSTPRGSPTRIW